MQNLIFLAVQNTSGDELPSLLFWPILALFFTMFLCMYLIYLKKRTSAKTAKILITIATALCIIAALVCLILIGVYYNKNIKDDGYYSVYLKNAGLYISSFALIALILALTFIIGKRESFEFDSHSVAFGAICIAMSFALSYIKIFDMPQGGSVTLASLFPVMLFAYIYGIKRGMLIGVIYGVLQAIQDPWIVHPMQFLLDYPIAFSAVGLAGAFSQINKLKKLPQVSFILGGICTGLFRYLAHFLSGAFAFGAYGVDAGFNNVYLYSLGYNSFVMVDIVIVLVIGCILFSSKAFVNEVIKKQRTKTMNNIASANSDATNSQNSEDVENK